MLPDLNLIFVVVVVCQVSGLVSSLVSGVTEAGPWLQCRGVTGLNDKGNTAQHHSELTVVDLPVTVLVHSRYHLLYLCQGDLAGNVAKDKFQFLWSVKFLATVLYLPGFSWFLVAWRKKFILRYSW